MNLAKELATEAFCHLFTIAVILLLTAGIAHRLGGTSCEHAAPFSAAASTRK